MNFNFGRFGAMGAVVSIWSFENRDEAAIFEVFEDARYGGR